MRLKLSFAIVFVLMLVFALTRTSVAEYSNDQYGCSGSAEYAESCSGRHGAESCSGSTQSCSGSYTSAPERRALRRAERRYLFRPWRR